MSSLILYILTVFLVTLAIFSKNPLPVFAAESNLNIASTHQLIDTVYSDGDIVSISTESGKLILSRVAFDEKMYGVIDMSPIIVYRTGEGVPIVRAGEVLVNVTTLNGVAEVGDYITSSQLPGKGQKATELAAYMLGRSLETFNEKEASSIDYAGKKILLGAVKVAVGIGPASPVLLKVSGGLFGTLRQLATSFSYNVQASKQTERIIRYIIAALVALVTIYINFRSFGSNITKGIESIGRNPLAKVPIQTMIIVNIILIAIVSLGGILLSLAIISL